MTHSYRTVDIPVDGGDLRVGIWDVDDRPDAPTALLLHGVTASHLSWPWIAERLPDVRLIAPDLRGRGRSNNVAGAAGMSTHAKDLAEVLTALHVDRTLVVGHSMGAFVAVVFAHQNPEMVSRLALIDGGLPLDVPEGLSSDEVVRHILGPAAERLAMTFTSIDNYFDYWRDHPAFATTWSKGVEDYLAYDLDGEAPELHAATSYAAMTDDTVDLNTGTAIQDALVELHHPSLLITAPRGLFDETPGLYGTERLDKLLSALPDVRHQRIPDTNHYTLVMSDSGAEQCANLIAEMIRNE